MLTNSVPDTLKDEKGERKAQAIASYYYYSDLSVEAIAWQLDLDVNYVQKVIDELTQTDTLKMIAELAVTRVEKIMISDVDCLSSSKTALDAVVLMDEKKISSVVVTKNEVPFGIITERDIVRRIGAKGIPLDKARLEDVASHPLIAAEPGLSVEEAADIMMKNKIHKLPVVGAGKLLGIITITDIASFLSPARRPGLSLSVLEAIARGRKAQETNLLFHKQ